MIELSNSIMNTRLRILASIFLALIILTSFAGQTTCCAGTSVKISAKLMESNYYISPDENNGESYIIFKQKDENKKTLAYKYSFSDNSTKKLSSDKIVPSFNYQDVSPISGKYFVFQGFTGQSKFHVYLINMETGEQKTITKTPENISSLNVAGNYAVWMSNTGAEPGIYYCDLKNPELPIVLVHKSKELTFNSAKIINTVKEQLIVFNDPFDGGIYVYNIVNKTTERINPEDQVGTVPVIFKNKIVYTARYCTASEEGRKHNYIKSKGSLVSFDRITRTTEKILDVVEGDIVFPKDQMGNPDYLPIIYSFIPRAGRSSNGDTVYLYDTMGNLTLVDQNNLSASIIVTNQSVSNGRFVYQKKILSSDPKSKRKFRYAILVYDTTSKNSSMLVDVEKEQISCGNAKILGNRIVYTSSTDDPGQSTQPPCELMLTNQ